MLIYGDMNVQNVKISNIIFSRIKIQGQQVIISLYDDQDIVSLVYYEKQTCFFVGKIIFSHLYQLEHLKKN